MKKLASYGRTMDSRGNRLLPCGHVAGDDMFCRVAWCRGSKPMVYDARHNALCSAGDLNALDMTGPDFTCQECGYVVCSCDDGDTVYPSMGLGYIRAHVKAVGGINSVARGLPSAAAKMHMINGLMVAGVSFDSHRITALLGSIPPEYGR